jgi:two-component system NtrC family response regulator
MKSLDILIAEDGRSQREILRDFLKESGHNVSEAANGKIALESLGSGYFDLLLLDIKMPEMDGMQVLEEVKRINPEIDVVMMTAYGTIDTAVKAITAGAADFITKPIELEELLIKISRISERRTLIKENKILREELREKGVTANQIVYQSLAMNEVVNLAGRIARSHATVLIEGESGTGKELIARLIHTLSPRADKPLIIVNCAALPENLLESELFGHEKGAFTGASQKRIGRFEEADGGTLFLDEIGDLNTPVQVKLLRFLQEREFQRVGGNQTIRSDVRIISATHQNLSDKVKERVFREDLYYRLNVVAIAIPPLRSRKDDLPPLLDHFIKKFTLENNKKIEGISTEARDQLLKYGYPGNVRELENIIERAVVITRNSVITTKDLPFWEAARDPDHGEIKSAQTLKESLEELERRIIQNALEETGNNQSKAAVRIGISERMLRYKINKYSLK